MPQPFSSGMPEEKMENYSYMNITYTVVPLMRDHKESPQKTVSQKGFALFGG